MIFDRPWWFYALVIGVSLVTMLILDAFFRWMRRKHEQTPPVPFNEYRDLANLYRDQTDILHKRAEELQIARDQFGEIATQALVAWHEAVSRPPEPTPIFDQLSVRYMLQRTPQE